MLCISCTLFLNVIIVLNASEQDRFEEELYIKPLPSGHVYAHFQFTTLVDKSLENRDQWRHSHLFPSSLGEMLSSNHVDEMHLSLSQGLWRYSLWGYPTRPSPPGAQLWVWFHPDTQNVEPSWKELVNSLSGQFCTSMNFGESGNTIQPFLSFPPEGAVGASVRSNSSLVRYAALSKENVCTENLTPLKKLLPCDTKAGLSQLLNAVNVLGSSYFALAVDVRSVCKTSSCTSTHVELRETVSVVFDPIKSHQHGKQDWSLMKLFGIAVNRACPVAQSSKIYVDITSNNTENPFVVSPLPSLPVITSGEKSLVVYDVAAELSSSSILNVKSIYNKSHIHWIRRLPTLHADRYVTGYGLEWGGIQCDIRNNLDRSLKVIYLDVLPWFLRVYVHTLKVSVNGQEWKPDWLRFRPGEDRKHPHHLELVVDLPARSVAQVSFQFQRAFLKWTEYPPDANHGFYVQSAVLTTLLSSLEPNATFLHRTSSLFRDSFLGAEEEVIVPIYTGSLLVTLPTPDFSMPYNCICLTCTVVALAFGPIHNITTKRLSRVDENEKKASLLDKLKGFFKRSSTQDTSDKKND